MKKKVLSALLVAAMSVSVLAGCGSKNDSKDSGEKDGFQTGYSGKSIFRY